MLDSFKKFLQGQELSESTQRSYLFSVQYFKTHYKALNRKNLLAYKGYLVEHFKPQTVNLRLQALNKYLEFQGKDTLKLKFVKVQQKNFLENVISNADYEFLKAQLKADGHTCWRSSGYLFLNRFGKRISPRGITHQLKHFAQKYGIPTEVVYPHSFRHRFAKNFLESLSDIALLADLMGHESIETTRIYLRRTATEQRQIVDEVIVW